MAWRGDILSLHISTFSRYTIYMYVAYTYILYNFYLIVQNLFSPPKIFKFAEWLVLVKIWISKLDWRTLVFVNCQLRPTQGCSIVFIMHSFLTSYFVVIGVFYHEHQISYFSFLPKKKFWYSCFLCLRWILFSFYYVYAMIDFLKSSILTPVKMKTDPDLI